jgi:hypothetical protein
MYPFKLVSFFSELGFGKEIVIALSKVDHLFNKDVSFNK